MAVATRKQSAFNFCLVPGSRCCAPTSHYRTRLLQALPQARRNIKIRLPLGTETSVLGIAVFRCQHFVQRLQEGHDVDEFLDGHDLVVDRHPGFTGLGNDVRRVSLGQLMRWIDDCGNQLMVRTACWPNMTELSLCPTSFATHK